MDHVWKRKCDSIKSHDKRECESIHPKALFWECELCNHVVYSKAGTTRANLLDPCPGFRAPVVRPKDAVPTKAAS